MKILILGHGRHGKDTVAEILHDRIGLEYSSSSWACADLFIFNALKDILNYDNVNECFKDRRNYRELWYELVRAYNWKDKSRLAKNIIKRNDAYIGMRDDEEYESSKRFFDVILWVEASKRVKKKDPTMKIEKDDYMIIIDNNKGLPHLNKQINDLILSGVFNA